jgi:pimeloyl-ACP methyl ester carboxylesterase
LANSPTEHRFASFDGSEIAWTELGRGRPVVLLHGLFSSGETNWLKYGTAAWIADAGFRVILPDFRGHGRSAAPQDAAAFPADVLALDIEALVRHLDLKDFDLGGYSLGGRTVVRLLARGMKPRRAVVAGMGLGGILDTGRRTAFFIDAIERRDSVARGTEAWMAAQFLKTTATDPVAAAHVLRAQVDTPRAALDAIATPVAVVCGADDRDNGSAADLAAALPGGRYVEIPGNHMSAVTKPELGGALVEALAAA